MNSLHELQSWYLAQCNDAWEHAYGVSIGTVDNPGWSLTVDLNDTMLSGKTHAGHGYGIGGVSQTSGNNWLSWKVENNKFIAYGGPEKLEEMINAFLGWTKDAA